MQGLVERVRLCACMCLASPLSVSLPRAAAASHICSALLPLQARQALGAGPDAFLPCTLEAQEQTLRELDVSAPNLQDMLKAAQGFAGDTKSMSCAPCCNTAPQTRQALNKLPAPLHDCLKVSWRRVPSTSQRPPCHSCGCKAAPQSQPSRHRSQCPQSTPPGLTQVRSS